MSRTVFCKKYQKEMEGLDAPPYPGPKGQEVFDNISKQAWEEWQAHQTMLINEKHLSLVDPEARKYLQGEMDKYFNQEGVHTVELIHETSASTTVLSRTQVRVDRTLSGPGRLCPLD